MNNCIKRWHAVAARGRRLVHVDLLPAVRSMHRLQLANPQPSLHGAFTRGTALLFMASCTAPAWAIPSPDLVVNVFANAAQIVGLVTVLIGSAAVSRRKKAARKRAANLGQASGPRWAVPVLSVLLCLSLGGLYLQWAHQKQQDTQRLQRNLVRTSMENGQAVGDTSLKTLSFSGQKAHPHGITTDQLATWLKEDPSSLNIVDVRETEETEAGMIQGAWHVRYPDLLAHPNKLASDTTADTQSHPTRTLLVCYSGNRSSELTDALNAQGLDVSFMVGGYEKWLSENRPLIAADGQPSTSRKELRSLPMYANRDTLLDTPDVEPLIQQGKALVIDVRYPEDFAKDAIPGAINLPLRKMSQAEMDQAIAGLPKDRPFVAACYDKRSSFYGQILGLKLTRSGRDYLGRYTVPHEYMVAKKQRDHVTAWQASQSTGLFGLAIKPLEAMLGLLYSATGSLVAAIVLAVVLMRMTFLKWSLANDKAQALQRRLKDQVAGIQAIKNRQERNQALMAWQKKQGINPFANLIGTVVQLVLFSAFFAAVSHQAQAHPSEGFGPLETLTKPVPFGLTSLLMAGVMFAHLKLGSTKTGRRAWVMPIAACLFLGAITLPLSAAVNIYLTCNIVLMFVQQRLVSRHVTQRLDQTQGTPMPAMGVCPLKHAHRVPGTGNKAIRLAQMMAEGLPVPDGFVVTDKAFADGESDQLVLTDATCKHLDQAWQTLGAEKVAVRSSGAKEDGEDKSFAGVFESVLNVTQNTFHDALHEVHASLRSTRAAAYTGTDDFDAGAAVVQEMVKDLTHAGVMFTEHPTDTGAMLIEYVDGLGEALVSGQATPKPVRVGRLSGKLLDGESDLPLPFEELAKLGQIIEQRFGKAQDIEWGYGQGQFWILQARDITVDGIKDLGDRQEAAFQQDRRLALQAIEQAAGLSQENPTLDAHADAFVMNELSELLPSPTPMSLSVMQKLWDAGGATDIACQQLGVPYKVDTDSAPMVMALAGQLVINQQEAHNRHRKGPSALTSYKLTRDAQAIADSYLQDVLPEYQQRVRLDEAVDFGRFGLNDLVDLFEAWTTRFVTETYVEAEQINILADMSVKSATGLLEKHGFDPALELACDEETAVSHAMGIVEHIAEGQADPRDFVAHFGHRAPHDYELAAPRYCEAPQLVQQLVDRAKQAAQHQAQQSNQKAKGESPKSQLDQAGRVVQTAVARARQFQVLKENAKHHTLREWAQLRRLLLAIDHELGLDGGIFYLTADEVLELPKHQNESSAAGWAGHLIAQRLSAKDALQDVALPAQMSVLALEKLSLRPAEAAPFPADGVLVGTAVSGVGAKRGRVRVVHKPEQIDAVEPGEILVTRFTDPSWTPLFSRIGGVVTEVGGRLSHAAIVAREYGLPAIVGVPNATQLLKSGDTVELKPNGSVTIVSDPSADVVITLQEGTRDRESVLNQLNDRMTQAPGSKETGTTANTSDRTSMRETNPAPGK